MDSPLDWSLIAAFLAVAEHGSLSAAARRLAVSQPTLGRRIAALEQQLGRDLFHRHARGLELTEDGLALMPDAEIIRGAMGRIALTAAGQAEQLEGTVRITASDMMSMYVLPPILAELRQQHPGIKIDLVPNDSTENLLFREADIAVRMYRPEQLELVTLHIGDMELGMFAAHAYLDRAGRPQTARDILDHALIGYDRNEEIIREMQERGWPATRDWFALRCDSHPVNWALLRAGAGIGFGPVCVGRDDPGVEELKLDLDIPIIPVWLTTHQALRHTPRIALVWTALEQGLKRHLS